MGGLEKHGKTREVHGKFISRGELSLPVYKGLRNITFRKKKFNKNQSLDEISVFLLRKFT
jgi:hypothetical protein